MPSEETNNRNRTARRSSRQPRSERRLSIRAIRREQPDIGRLGRAFIALAMADAEREAQHANQEQDDANRDQSTVTIENNANVPKVSL